MNEITLQYIYFSRIIVVALFALLYGLGGMNGKWKRRFLAPAILTLAICGYSLLMGTFSLVLISFGPLLSAALCLGYGADSFGVKLKKRAIYGIATSIAAIPIAIVTGQWLLFLIHVALNIVGSIMLGTQNPIPARGEETMIGFYIGFIPIMMV
jgi:hypothetical protein